jgi:hypothetical protein
MLQKIIEIVAERAREVIIEDPALPNEVNDQAVEAAGAVVGEEILGILKGGNVADILGMFQRFMSNGSNAELLKGVVDRYSVVLTGKFGLHEGSAQELSSKLIPELVSHLVRRVVDPKDERLSIQDFSSYVLNELPQLRSLVQMVSESSVANGGSLKDLAAAGVPGANGDTLEGILAGLVGRK